MVDAVLKIGKKRHMEDLIYNGSILLKRLSYYQKHENPEICDENEGLTHLYQSDYIKKFTIDGKEITPMNQIKLRINNYPNPFIYCMYGIYPEDIVISIDERCNEFGDTVVLITDINKFRDRIYKATNSLSSQRVEYIPLNKYNGKLNVYTKTDNFSHQKEFRFSIESKDNAREKLIKIGSLEDIAIIKNIKDLKITRK